MTWHALPGPAQVALAWAVNIGGHAWTSELAALADLEAAGLVHRDADDSSWRAATLAFAALALLAAVVVLDVALDAAACLPGRGR